MPEVFDDVRDRNGSKRLDFDPIGEVINEYYAESVLSKGEWHWTDLV